MRLPIHAKGSEKHREQPVYRWDLGDVIQYYKLTGDNCCLMLMFLGRCVLMFCYTPGHPLIYLNLYYNNIVGCLRKDSCD